MLNKKGKNRINSILSGGNLTYKTMPHTILVFLSLASKIIQYKGSVHK